MPTTVPRPRTRKPTGKPSWPLILIAGEGKTGKTYAAAAFTGDERVGESFLLDLGEGSADEYIEVPGARYEIVDHDGTWISIISEVETIRDFARAELAAGHAPVCLIIDSMTAEWGMLSAWTDTRARRSKANKALLADDPDAEIEVGHMYWNDANSRHNRLVNILKTFPGIVIVTAQETEKTQFGADGRPLKVNGKAAPKVARPDAHKRLPADATVWIRLSHEHPPVIVGMRSLKHNIQPGKQRPEAWPDFTIARLVFDYMGLTADAAQARNTPTLDADQTAPGEESDTPPRPQVVRTAEQNAAYAQAGVAKMLAASMAPAAQELRKRAENDPSGQVDVREWVSEAHREVLGILPDVASLTLAQLGQIVCDYVERRNTSVNAVVNADDAGPDDILTAQNGDQISRADLEQFVRDDKRMVRDILAG